MSEPGRTENPPTNIEQAGNLLIGCWARSRLMNSVIEAWEADKPVLSDRKEILKRELAQRNQGLTEQALEIYQKVRERNFLTRLTHQDGRLSPQQQDTTVTREVINPLLAIAQETEGCNG